MQISLNVPPPRFRLLLFFGLFLIIVSSPFRSAFVFIQLFVTSNRGGASISPILAPPTPPPLDATPP